MNNELDEALYRDFPVLFRKQLYVDCGDGWEPIIRMTCDRIMSPINQTNDTIESIENVFRSGRKLETDFERKFFSSAKIIELSKRVHKMETEIPIMKQIREKFGGLRFYMDGGTGAHWDIVDAAEAMSYYVCEQCGTMKNVKLYTKGWHRTLCIDHAPAL